MPRAGDQCSRQVERQVPRSRGISLGMFQYECAGQCGWITVHKDVGEASSVYDDNSYPLSMGPLKMHYLSTLPGEDYYHI